MPASIVNPNMTRQDFPHQTIDSAISMFDRDNQYREHEWEGAEGVPDWLYRDDSVINKVLDMVQSQSSTKENPVVYWTEMSRLEVATTITAEVNSSATTLVLDDNKLVAAGMNLFAPETGEWLSVTARTDDNVTVTRGQLGTTAATIKKGASLISQAQFMSELDEPKLGVSKLPGERQYNFVSVFGTRFGVSHFQNNSKVKGGWGQLPLVTLQQWADLRRRAGFAALFAPRYTANITDKGQLYVGGGVQSFIKSNILPIGGDSSVLNWENLNDFMRNAFAPDASSNQKLLLAGPKLYRNMLRTAREATVVTEGPYWSPALSADTFTASVDGGTVSVVEAKHDLPEQGKYQLGDYGIGLDLGNMYSGNLKGFEWKIVPEVQTALGSITQRQDAIVGSQSVILKHESTHFLIKGAPDRNVKRVEIG